MKRLLFLICMFFSIVGCSDDDNKIPYVEDELLKLNNITNVVAVYQKSPFDYDESSYTIYTGCRKQRDWIAIFDYSGKLIKEWYGRANDESSGEIYPNIGQTNLVKIKENVIYINMPGHENRTNYLARLNKDGSVDYGFKLTGANSHLTDILTNNRFACRDRNLTDTYNILDFEGNIIIKNALICSSRDRKPEDPFIALIGKKLWVGYFDKEGQFKEIISDEDYIRTIPIKEGYGEAYNLEIDDIKVTHRILDTSCGICLMTDYYRSFRNFISVYNGKVYFNICPYVNTEGPTRVWYNSSILVLGCYVFTPKAEPITRLIFTILTEDESMATEPVSYNEAIVGIHKSKQRSISRKNLTALTDNNHIVWASEITKLSELGDVKASTVIESKKDKIWHYRCDYIHQNGEKGSFKFDVQIDDGEITYPD